MHIKHFAMSLSTPNDDAVAPKPNPILLIHAATVANDVRKSGNDSNLLIVFYVQIMPDDFVMQLHRF